MTGPVVVVVGALHHDIVVDAPRQPLRGETLMGASWAPKFGGKGANQAVAARRAGVRVRMVGAVGDDDFGDRLLAGLAAADVDSAVVRLPGAASGMSVAILDADGDYAAVVVSGANRLLDPAALAAPALWRDGAVLLLQNEIPAAVNLAAARHARAAGLRVVLNAAPARALSPDLAALLDALVVNAVEAEQLTGLPVRDLSTAEAAAAALLTHAPLTVVTAGAAGAAACTALGAALRQPARPVARPMAHGAGDAFTGALAAALALGAGPEAALAAAAAAARRHVAGEG